MYPKAAHLWDRTEVIGEPNQFSTILINNWLIFYSYLLQLYLDVYALELIHKGSQGGFNCHLQWNFSHEIKWSFLILKLSISHSSTNIRGIPVKCSPRLVGQVLIFPGFFFLAILLIETRKSWKYQLLTPYDSILNVSFI